jgi:hypothetical protein
MKKKFDEFFSKKDNKTHKINIYFKKYPLYRFDAYCPSCKIAKLKGFPEGSSGAYLATWPKQIHGYKCPAEVEKLLQLK